MGRLNDLSGTKLRERWIANAERLDRLGHFVQYSPKQRADVLRRGYIGLWAPDQAIRIARREADLGYALRTSKFVDNMRDLKVVGAEVREKVLSILDETPPESYEPPYELEEPPGYPFIFRSNILRCETYFKFQIEDTAKTCRALFWSSHPLLSKRK